VKSGATSDRSAKPGTHSLSPLDSHRSFNAAAEAFFSSLEWEVLSRHQLLDPDHARAVVLPWCYDFYNHRRRHSTAHMLSPIDYENLTEPTADQPAAA
jgi:transposase InsO family protein